MRCYDADKVRPLDELFGDTTGEFESGRDKVCDKDLDAMIWELGDYQNEEPLQEADEYEDVTPIEDDLVEKTMVVDRKGRVSFAEVPEAEEAIFAERTDAFAGAIGGETRRKPTAAVRTAATVRSAKPGQKTSAAQKTKPAQKAAARNAKPVQKTAAARGAKPVQKASPATRKAQPRKKAVAATRTATPARKTGAAVRGRTPAKKKTTTASPAKRRSR